MFHTYHDTLKLKSCCKTDIRCPVSSFFAASLSCVFVLNIDQYFVRDAGGKQPFFWGDFAIHFRLQTLESAALSETIFRWAGNACWHIPHRLTIWINIKMASRHRQSIGIFASPLPSRQFPEPALH